MEKRKQDVKRQKIGGEGESAASSHVAELFCDPTLEKITCGARRVSKRKMSMIHEESLALNTLTSAIISQSIMTLILVILRDLPPVTILPTEQGT